MGRHLKAVIILCQIMSDRLVMFCGTEENEKGINEQSRQLECVSLGRSQICAEDLFSVLHV